MKRNPTTDARIMEIAQKYPTPFHLYDERGIRENARMLAKAFGWNKGFREYFAVKACPNPVLIKILMQEGCGLDCSSMTELMLAEALGAKGEQIMFSSNDTPAEEFEYARELGASVNLDDISHIDFLQKHGGIPELVCCRYNPGGDFKLGNFVMGNPRDAKYGFTREQLSVGFKRLQELGAKRFGLHAFLASNMLDVRYYPELARILFETAAELNRETGADIAFINLSGGIGIPYLPDEAPVDIRSVGERVREVYDSVFKDGVRPALYTELGRYMTGPFGWLVTRVLHQKHIHKDYVGVDACAADLMRPAMYGAYHHISVVGKTDRPHDHVYDVTGALCENNDKFAIDRPLPEIDNGDILLIHDTGAHGHAMGYNYNGKLRSAEILLRENGGDELIRRAETPRDYFATLDFLNLFGK